MGPKSPKTFHYGGLNRHFKPNMGKIQIAISSDLCTRLTWNLTGSCGHATKTSWVVSYSGKTILRWRMAAILKIDISPCLSEKSSDFDEILYTAANFELNDQKWKSCIGQTPSSTKRISCLLYSSSRVCIRCTLFQKYSEKCCAYLPAIMLGFTLLYIC